jgi:catechol 2,3-dioxygenase-like lactoylglutathione lyase family enzyme
MSANPRADILRGAPYFPVADVARTGDYYREVLGFEREYAAGDPPEFAVYSRSGSPIMFRRVADATLIRPNESQGGTWDVFFWVNDIVALYDELSRKGAVAVYAPVVQPYGMKEFAVRDPNGYVLGFGQQWTQSPKPSAL